MGEFTSAETAADWERMIALNLNTSFHCFRAVIPGFRERAGGWIVAMGSMSVNHPPARTAAYVATKAALVAMALSVSQEVKGDGIHVNLIQAGTIDTPANRADMGDEAAKKWVRPEDVAEATLYLCSERAGSCFGTTLELYGKQ
jgi:NAD(P)-dependent dehydrogenase (short-subunit alcohol dehydrogenase family)